MGAVGARVTPPSLRFCVGAVTIDPVIRSQPRRNNSRLTYARRDDCHGVLAVQNRISQSEKGFTARLKELGSTAPSQPAFG